jgi:polysaccharide biosynthesis protein PslH
MSRRKCIFISAHLPSPTMPVAGQRIAYRNLQKLCNMYDVVFISFINKFENQYFDESLYDICYRKHFFYVSNINRVVSFLLNPLQPSRVNPRLRKDVKTLLDKYINQEDISVFHAEYTAAMSYIDQFSRNVRSEVVEHDVVYQSLERYCKNKEFPINLFFCFEAKKQKRWELKKLSLFNEVIVLNEKDEKLLDNENIKNIKISPPILDEWIYKVYRPVQRVVTMSLLFYGAMQRFENQDAATWFVKEIMPIILKRNPMVKLYIVGGHPPKNIQNLSSSSVVVTGYVTSLKSYFEKADVAIAPLRYGAGIKIKTLETLAAKIPTVSTKIGAEGVAENPLLTVTDSASEFAENILRLLDSDKNSIDGVVER